MANPEPGVGSLLAPTFEHAFANHALIRPDLERAAARLGVQEGFDRVPVHVRSRTGWFDFHMLRGVIARAPVAGLRLPGAAFRAMLFVDFGRWRDCDDFVDRMTPILRRSGSTIEPFRLREFLSAWYRVSYAAAEAFFADRARLARYFRTPHFSEHWQLESGAGRHDLYARGMGERIQCAGRAVLDIGSGLGRFLTSYAEAAVAVAADVSATMLARAAGRSRRVSFCQCDVADLPFRAASFDVVMALQIMMHVSDPFAVVERLGGLLRPAGDLWVDFTCTRRDEGRPFYQESFLTRIYSPDYVRRRCTIDALTLEESEWFPDRGRHGWLMLHLRRSDVRPVPVAERPDAMSRRG